LKRIGLATHKTKSTQVTMSAAFLEQIKGKARLAFNQDVGDDVSEQEPDRFDEMADLCPELTFQQVSASGIMSVRGVELDSFVYHE
jgi:hypothetical protein